MLCKNLRLAALVVVVSVCGTSAASARKNPCPPQGVDSRCCALSSIIDNLQRTLFNGSPCNKAVRQSVRLAFHDAIGFSKSSPSGGGGADGSILIFSDTELQNGANTALGGLVQRLKNILSEYRSQNTSVNVSAGDIVQLAAAVGISHCPGAPQLSFLLGRPNATMPAEDDMIPDPSDSADTILNRFNDTGFSPPEVVALLASHSIATSSFVQPGAEFDCTPQVFDTRFFAEVQNKTQNNAQCAIPTRPTIRIPSDTALSRDNRTASIWGSFINDQAGMASAFRDAMAKLAVVGQDTSNMIDCSAMIPPPPPPPPPPPENHSSLNLRSDSPHRRRH